MATANPPRRLDGPALTLGAMMSVQLGATAAVPLMLAHGVLGLTALRLAVAAVIMLAISRPAVRRFTRHQWRTGIALGAATGAMTICFFEAITRIPVGAAITIDFLGPLGLAARSLAGWPRFALPGLAAAGVAAITCGPGGWVFAPAGIGFALASAVCWAGYIVLTRRAGQAFSQLQGLAVSFSVAAAGALPLALLVAPREVTAGILPAATGLALLVPVIPFILEMMALRRMEVGVFSIMMSLEPAFGCLFGFVLLGQQLAPRQLAGVAGVMLASAAAVYLTSFKPRPAGTAGEAGLPPP